MHIDRCFTDQEYKIIVSTSGRFAAGTDAKVFIQLFGIDGQSEEIELKDKTKGKKLFEAGRYKNLHIISSGNLGRKDRILKSLQV